MSDAETHVQLDEDGSVDEVQLYVSGHGRGAVAHMECMGDYHWLRIGDFVAHVKLLNVQELPDKGVM